MQPPPGAGVGIPQSPYNGQYPQSIATAPNGVPLTNPQYGYGPQFVPQYGANLGAPPGVDLRLQAAQQQLTAGTNAIAQAAQLSQQNAFSARSLTGGAAQLPSVEAIAARLNVSVQALVRVAGDHLVWVLETVRDPGTYIAAEGTTLADMIQTAGGLLRQADLTSIEVTSTQIDPQSAHHVRRGATIAARRATFSASACSPWT